MLPYYCLKCRKNAESKKQKVENIRKKKNNTFIRLCGLWN